MNKNCKQYISDVKSLFPIMGKNEKKYIDRLISNLDDYCSEAQIETKQDLYESYGTPSQIVIDYFSSADTEYIVKKVRTKKIVFAAVGVVLALALAVSLAFGISYYQEYQSINNQKEIISDIIDTIE